MKTTSINLLSRVAQAAVCVALMLLASQAGATPIPIDDFNVPSQPQTLLSGTDASATWVDLKAGDKPGNGGLDIYHSNILGGGRDLTLKPTGKGNTYTVAVGAGELDFATSGAKGTSLDLQYSGKSGNHKLGKVYATNYASELNTGNTIDLTDKGANNHFFFDFANTGTKDFVLKAIVDYKLDSTTTFTTTETATVHAGSTGFDLAFAGFSDPGSGKTAAYVLEHADHVEFQFNNPDDGKPVEGVGFELREIQAVPEPSTLALGGIGGLVLLGNVVLRKWRRDAAAK